MNFITILFITSALLSVVAMIPQIKKLRETKNSDEFNVFTWSIWTFGQVVGIAYAISVGANAFLFVSALWLLFYVYMVSLIIKYRPKKYAMQQSLENVDFYDESTLYKSVRVE